MHSDATGNRFLSGALYKKIWIPYRSPHSFFSAMDYEPDFGDHVPPSFDRSVLFPIEISIFLWFLYLESIKFVIDPIWLQVFLTLSRSDLSFQLSNPCEFYLFVCIIFFLCLCSRILFRLTCSIENFDVFRLFCSLFFVIYWMTLSIRFWRCWRLYGWWWIAFFLFIFQVSSVQKKRDY